MIRLDKLTAKFATQKVLILFGAPGVGKGTFAKLLRRDLQFNHVSTGNEIRKIIKGTATTKFDPNLISDIKQRIKSGGLVSDQIAVEIVRQKFKDPESAKGVILDGFPRTKGQLDLFLNYLPKIDGVVNLTVRQDVLLEMLMGRRTCINCGTGYNVNSVKRDGYEMDPIRSKKQGICDNCGNELIIRDDDTEKVILERMKEYSQKTKPLLTEFEKMGNLLSLQCKKGVKDYPELKSIIINKLK